MEKDLAEIKESLARLERAVLGDEKIGHVGIASRLDNAEKKVAAVDTRMMIWSGAVLGITWALQHLRGWFGK